MESRRQPDDARLLKALPSVDLLLHTDAAGVMAAEFGRGPVTRAAREVIDSLRTSVMEGDISEGDRESLLETAKVALADEMRASRRRSLKRVINAAGVIVHTNLGRSPLSKAAVEAIAEASGYCNLEYDLETGNRGRRGVRAEEMLCELTGAEEGLIVNNCAAAAVLVLTSLCEGGDAVISRGELVEIGGDFRVPDVMKRSGAGLVEVGTTNRTKISDYEKAIGENTRLLLKVHPSNYRIIGFTSAPSVSELSALARDRGLVLYEDAGSGALIDLRRFGLDDEPVIAESISAGADVVTFSGDKLLGSVQSGLIVGRGDVIRRIRSHPLYRAFRGSKIVYAALEATFESFLKGTMFEDVPTLRMLAASTEELASRTESAASELRERLGAREGLSIDIVEGTSVVGGGSAPAATRGNPVLALGDREISARELEERLRAHDPPVIARIEDDRLLIDLRTVPQEEEEVLKNAVCGAFRLG